MHPLLILLIGVVAVIGLIIVLRVNAFIALIVAAMLVSLLATGDLAAKISRVATAFGGGCAAIGIVIALAAVIGKCLMDSGAADRIVRAFLKVLGEKRSSFALMGSGFVLSVPVFFDTVFYLLVPLARSMWRRTKKNYILYTTAIVAGAGVTHTLVPPTPGPLFMAHELNIDLGMMIGIGLLIGLPTALLGVFVCKTINRFMDIPMRPYGAGAEKEPEPLEDERLPSLWVSLLPVLLPVVLIAANTVGQTLADAEHAALLRPGDVKDWPALCVALTAQDGETPTIGRHLMQKMPERAQDLIRQGAAGGELNAEAKETLFASLNALLKDKELYQREAFVGFLVPDNVEALVQKGFKRSSPAEVEHVNRLLLEAVYLDQINAHVWKTPRREAADMTALLGNPNFALLLSAAIAMLILLRSRGLSLKQLAQTAEIALMSGGVIILITAAGGAFGAMLREAGIQKWMAKMVGDGGGQGTGTLILLAAFATAVVIKFAQGSGTVSMITTVGIFAGLGISTETLGFHPVYLAMAIGSGSLVGDWMNNSGFWIFAKMSVLTEVETLKSWTILTASLGIIGLIITILVSKVLPLMPAA